MTAQQMPSRENHGQAAASDIYWLNHTPEAFESRADRKVSDANQRRNRQ